MAGGLGGEGLTP